MIVATYGTFVDNTTLKASELNDFFKRVSFTPVVRQPSSVATSTSNRSGTYFQVNKLVLCFIDFNVSGAGTSSNRIELDLPVTAASNSVRVIGSGYFFDTSIDDIRRLAVVQYSTTRAALITGAATSPTAYFGATNGPNTALASNDDIYVKMVYEAA